MFNRTDDELLEQTNSVEGSHHSFQAHISSYHPVFWKFLIILRNEESLFRVSMKKHLARHPPPPQRQRYLACKRRILAIVDDFPNLQTLQHLRSIAHNFQFMQSLYMQYIYIIYIYNIYI